MPTATAQSLLEFNPVTGTGCEYHEHIFPDRYYVGEIIKLSSGYKLSSRHFAGGTLPSLDEAREVVRMWVDSRASRLR